nr:hypothetical protein [uncultured Rhodopila sp.]
MSTLKIDFNRPSVNLSSDIIVRMAKPAGNCPGRLTCGERGMMQLNLLPDILVKIGVKVKIIIVRK